MTREILFRGKREDNGKWVYGYYFQWDKAHYILVNQQFYDVIPETLGQFTGLTDKNGNKIFEGDIISGCNFDWYYKTGQAIVKYNDGSFSPFAVPNWECSEYPEDVEVIGNIHEEETK